MDKQKSVLEVLDRALGLGGRSLRFSSDTALLGALPELDSMAVVALIGMLEESFGFIVADDEIDGSVFATVGSLVEFVDRKLSTV